MNKFPESLLKSLRIPPGVTGFSLVFKDGNLTLRTWDTSHKMKVYGLPRPFADVLHELFHIPSPCQEFVLNYSYGEAPHMKVTLPILDDFPVDLSEVKLEPYYEYPLHDAERFLGRPLGRSTT
jgi:hypothetical protein